LIFPPIPEGLRDGLLTAYEVSTQISQGAEMVGLNACETGLGKAKAGERVLGLLRVFEEAEGDSLVIPMWELPDAKVRGQGLLAGGWYACYESIKKGKPCR